MQDTLKIKLDQDDDGGVCVIAKVYSGNFSGEGEAYFNISDIKELSNNLTEFIKTQANPPSIKGGNWDGKGNLIEILLSLKFYSFSNYRFGVLVNLTDHPYTECREEEISRVTVELKPNTHELSSFVEQINKLIHSEIKEAVLTCQ